MSHQPLVKSIASKLNFQKSCLAVVLCTCTVFVLASMETLLNGFSYYTVKDGHGWKMVYSDNSEVTLEHGQPANGHFEYRGHTDTPSDTRQTNYGDKGGTRLSLSHPLENACKYPVLRPNDKSLARWDENPRTVHCAKRQPTLSTFDYDAGALYLHYDVHDRAAAPAVCGIRQVETAFRPKDTYNKLAFVGHWTPLKFNRAHRIDYEAFAVRCLTHRTRGNASSAERDELFEDEGNIMYQMAYYQILPKEDAPSIDEPGINTMSVDVMELDSVSFNQFRRHMTKSWRLMRYMGFEWLEGYHKVADNSDPNAFPTLAGMRLGDQAPGHLNEVPGYPGWVAVDDIDWLWKHVPQACAKLWNDDIDHTYGLFSYHRGVRGFTRKPFSHYSWPWHMFNQAHMLNDSAERHCMKNEHYAPLLFDITERFMRQFARQCHFSFSTFSETSHNYPHRLSTLDDILHGMLQRLRWTGALDNTTLVIMGDHGNRAANIRSLYYGRIESRMPLFTIRFPKWFSEKHPELIENLRVNRHRLTANYDVHQMLYQLVTANFSQPSPTAPPHGNRGVSLLTTRMSPERDCDSAGVPEQYCTCTVPSRMDPVIVNEWRERALNASAVPLNFTLQALANVERMWSEDVEAAMGILAAHVFGGGGGDSSGERHTGERPPLYREGAAPNSTSCISPESDARIRYTEGTLRYYTVSDAVRLGIYFMFGEELEQLKKRPAMEINFVEMQAELRLSGHTLSLLARFQRDMAAERGTRRYQRRLFIAAEPMVLSAVADGGDVLEGVLTLADFCARIGRENT